MKRLNRCNRPRRSLVRWRLLKEKNASVTGFQLFLNYRDDNMKHEKTVLRPRSNREIPEGWKIDLNECT